MTMSRQGDVLIIPISDKKVSKSAKKLPRDNGRVVLAHGEVTGHAHAIGSTRATLFREDGTGSGGRTILQVTGDAPVELQHEEHATISLTPGLFEIRRQQEFPRAAPARQVLD